MKLTLGQRVQFTDTLIKVRDENGNATYASGGLPAIKDAWLKSREVNEGVVVGMRTLTDFEITREAEFSEWSGSTSYYTVTTPVPGTGRRAALIAFDLRRKPAYVLLDHITPLEES
ncbi:hypothetical protein SEA_BRUHMOMENT_56 [Arthrobacter phage BruhMoment]|nr:hypothetical protein SEA_BRUHMOMENT_56 [Arthrobacter phage BruhMoment]